MELWISKGHLSSRGILYEISILIKIIFIILYSLFLMSPPLFKICQPQVYALHVKGS